MVHQLSSIVLPDGATLAYEVLGVRHLGRAQPIVLVGGMTSRRVDWDRLAESLEKEMPVLVFDHRGIGDSTLTLEKSEKLSIEMMARDMLFLLSFLGWKNISICGFSMGGVITQQLIVLPYHPTNPTPLSFHVTHLFMAGTLTTLLMDKKYGLRLDFKAKPKKLTQEEKRAIAKTMLEGNLDPTWINDPRNKGRFELLVERNTIKRPAATIHMQARAMAKYDFSPYYSKFPQDIEILIIHGENDATVPFKCGEEIAQRFPQAQFVEIGMSPGQIPSLAFGHLWYEYFDIIAWHNVITRFLEEGQKEKARL